jgi:hypothetical protein
LLPILPILVNLPGPLVTVPYHLIWTVRPAPRFRSCRAGARTAAAGGRPQGRP